jgi:hypothetical protein
MSTTGTKPKHRLVDELMILISHDLMLMLPRCPLNAALNKELTCSFVERYDFLDNVEAYRSSFCTVLIRTFAKKYDACVVWLLSDALVLGLLKYYMIS